MKLIAEAGLWATGTPVAAPPAVAVLEVAGAVLSWTVDDASAPAHATFTDVAAADWLWRVAGERGHVAVIGALHGVPAEPQAIIDVSDLSWAPEALAPLRRLALGHWLRRWWPASVRDAIADLDQVVLDAEIAVLTAAAQDFFHEDTIDSDIDGLLQPHRDTLSEYLRTGDPRVSELVRACVEAADWPEPAQASAGAPAERRRDDYALAAGGVDGPAAGVIAAGTASIEWTAVPAGVFDAAENTVDWAVRAGAAEVVVAAVRTAVRTSAAGIPVRLRSGDVAVDAALRADGTASLPLPIAESAAWNHDWTTTSVTVGAPPTGETRELRERVRAFARSRLAGGDDVFLAEVLAAESDY